MTLAGNNQSHRIGPWTFTAAEKTLVHDDGHSITLEDKISSLLETLCERRGDIVSKEALIAAVWQGRELSEQTIPVAISKLRKALGDDINSPKMLATVPRQGYQLLPIQAETDKAPTNKGIVIAGAALAVALVVALAFSGIRTTDEPIDRIQYSNAEKPAVIVTINDVRTTDDAKDTIPLAIAASEMSSFFLAQVPDLLVIRHWWNLDAPDPTGGIYTRYGAATPVYSLKGTLLNDAIDGKVITFVLSDPKTDEVIWSGLHVVDEGSTGLFRVFDSMIGQLPIRTTAMANAPDETVSYWRARYFMQLSNPGAARVAANELTDLLGSGETTDVAKSSARALAARWKNNEDVADDMAVLESLLTSSTGEQDPSGGHLTLVDRAAQSLFTSSDAETALRFLEEALSRAPGDHYALSLYGEAKLMQGRREEAVDAYKRAFRLAPYARAYEARLRELETQN